MNENVINNPEKFCICITGTFNRGEEPPLIFQRSRGTLQKKIGPIIPTNPQTRLQQLNRLRFRAAMDNADSMTDEQKAIYHKQIAKARRGLTWRIFAIKQFLRPNRFNRIKFDEGLLCGGAPQRDAFRFDEISFDDAFLITEEVLPLNKQAIINKYPHINIASIFPE